MEQRDASSWQDFVRILKELSKEYGHHEFGDYKQENITLFRGLSNSEWELSTTLERASSGTWSIRKYARIAHTTVPQIESFTDTEWTLPATTPDLDEQIQTSYHSDNVSGTITERIYAYWIYLRHHGFPSPLLDWSESPYIAGYFAFASQTKADRIAVYAYIGWPEGYKTGWEGISKITTLGPYVRSHRRHFLQQSWYTIATKADEEREDHIFVPHESVFEDPVPHQDILVKITLPSAERVDILKRLNSYNINHFSLFQTEDALVKALAVKEIVLKGL